MHEILSCFHAISFDVSIIKNLFGFCNEILTHKTEKNPLQKRPLCVIMYKNTHAIMNFSHERSCERMSLKKYEAFVRTAELGSLTKAAESLGSTQSRISHILSDLEEEFGFSLILCEQG